jgi:hypothetical protein
MEKFILLPPIFLAIINGTFKYKLLSINGYG